MPVARVAGDETLVLEVREGAAQRLAGYPQPAGERGEAAAAGAADLGEHGQRPAVVTERDES
jgi:hypothetical protein